MKIEFNRTSFHTSYFSFMLYFCTNTKKSNAGNMAIIDRSAKASIPGACDNLR